jgi:hypothetical protein
MLVFLRHLGSLLGQMWRFAWSKKAWWLVPLVVILLLATAIVVVGTIAAPFIYTLF